MPIRLIITAVEIDFYLRNNLFCMNQYVDVCKMCLDIVFEEFFLLNCLLFA